MDYIDIELIKNIFDIFSLGLALGIIVWIMFYVLGYAFHSVLSIFKKGI